MTWVLAISLPKVIRQQDDVLYAQAIIINIENILVNAEGENEDVLPKHRGPFVDMREVCLKWLITCAYTTGY